MLKLILVVFLGAAGDATYNGLTVGQYTYHIDIPTGAATLGPTAPSSVTQDDLVYLAFSDGEQIVGQFELPTCYVSNTNVDLEIYWASESGDAIANGETVIWDCSYRAIDWGVDTTTGDGALATASNTYTESGSPGTDKATHKSGLDLVYNDAQQPLAAGLDIVFLCERDAGAADTYSGDPRLSKIEAEIQCTGIPNH